MGELRLFMENLSRKTGFSGELRFDEPMASHTTFKVGGPADCWVCPAPACFPEYAPALLAAAREAGTPVFVLGGGANLVVADRGIRGIVLDTGSWTGWDFTGEAKGPGDSTGSVTVRAGTPADELINALAERGRGGLEFLAGMPGTIGGMVWMNARCMERSVSDVLIETEILDEQAERVIVPYNHEDFSYKKSPFQGRKVLILGAKFRVFRREAEEIKKEAEILRIDRESRGHYRAPSAGSAFKNNRDFGKPAGKIIDELGLRGFSVGGAAVAPWHGNFIINTGNASAAGIRALVTAVTEKVRDRTGFTLEPEILFVGDWGGV
ncbi:MAG: UDP-N-acetylmuramate dehydrogenase [Treponema sp.]|nr:UDP-N-acetylmuramate dehydrogenase [Treponema sp.]